MKMTYTKEEIKALVEEIASEAQTIPDCLGIAGILVIATEKEGERKLLSFSAGRRNIDWSKVINIIHDRGDFDLDKETLQ